MVSTIKTRCPYLRKRKAYKIQPEKETEILFSELFPNSIPKKRTVVCEAENCPYGNQGEQIGLIRQEENIRYLCKSNGLINIQKNTNEKPDFISRR